MLSKNRLKFIKSLQIKKYRNEHRLFLVEGAKSVSEIISSDYKIHSLFLTDNFFNCSPNANIKVGEFELVKPDELSSAGTFDTNNAALAIVHMKDNQPIEPLKDKYYLMLDDVKDPGNLGTIIRIADWYGVEGIICSNNTADYYNPKVIAASMGSFSRINIFYTDLIEYLDLYPDTPVYAAALNGESVYEIQASIPGIIVMGNESKGISGEILAKSKYIINIPKIGKAESLNVGVATAVILDNLTRKMQR